MFDEFQSHKVAYVSVLQGTLPALVALFMRAYQTLPDYAERAANMEEKRLRILAFTERIKSDLSARTSIEEEARKSLMSRASLQNVF